MATKTRDQLRDLVRDQIGFDDDELPDTLLDPWLQEGYEQTLAIEERWPFLEETWDITTVGGQLNYSKTDLAAAHPSGYSIDQIVSLRDLTGSARSLVALPHGRAEDTFGLGTTGGGVPAYWSEWGGDIYLWEAPSDGRTVRLRGYRRPQWDDGDAVEVDADSRLHVPIYYFAVAMAYGQQEDEILMGEWTGKWQAAIRQAHSAIMAEPQRRPMILSGTTVRYFTTPMLDV